MECVCYDRKKEYGRCRFLRDWNDWQKSTHEREDQILRQGRAMTYPFAFEINHKKEKGVFSSTTDLPYYETTLTNCTCYDFQERHLPCKHIYRLAVELGLIEIFNRPSHNKELLAEVKASSDIDKHPEQLKRIESSKNVKCTPISIDYENQSAIFSGSGKSPYLTTIDTCTCRDYFIRHLPCKHIYRLRDELKKTNNTGLKLKESEKY